MTLKRRLHAFFAPLIYSDGNAFVPKAVSAEWAERQFLRRLLRRLNVDCVIDVGANCGQFAEQLRLIGYRGTIISFEPSPDSFARLSAKCARDERWHAFELALGAEAGTLLFNRMKASEFDSFRQPSKDIVPSIEPHNEVVEQISVTVDRLDRLWGALQKQFSFSRPFLKTDTQGFDVEVFRGAAGVQTQLRGIQCELAIKQLYREVLPWTEAITVYIDAGFELSGLFPVYPEGDDLFEVNGYFVRN